MPKSSLLRPPMPPLSHSSQTIPIDYDTTLSNRQMMIAVILKTLTPLIPANLQCTDHSSPTVICPCCSKSCDSFGIHSFQCPKDGHKYRTQLLHDKLCKVWYSALRHAGYKVLLEPSGMVLSNAPMVRDLTLLSNSWRTVPTSSLIFGPVTPSLVILLKKPPPPPELLLTKEKPSKTKTGKNC